MKVFVAPNEAGKLVPVRLEADPRSKSDHFVLRAWDAARRWAISQYDETQRRNEAEHYLMYDVIDPDGPVEQELIPARRREDQYRTIHMSALDQSDVRRKDKRVIFEDGAAEIAYEALMLGIREISKGAAGRYIGLDEMLGAIQSEPAPLTDGSTVSGTLDPSQKC